MVRPANSEPEQNGSGDARSVAEELQQESERLGQLAAKLKAREASLAEMERNYPYFQDFVYRKLREEFGIKPEEQTDLDLEKLARECDAKPLEEFIDEFERTAACRIPQWRTP